MSAESETQKLDDEWICEHFDVHAPELAYELYPTLARAREICPVAHSDRHGGYWVVTSYEDVLRVAQDWETFSNELGITIKKEGQKSFRLPMKILPVGIDPPLHRTFKRLINAYFTPQAVAPYEAETRALAGRLIDGFIEKGECDFMAEFARPLPGLSFFELALHAPPEDLQKATAWAMKASSTDTEASKEGVTNLAMWLAGFLKERQEAEPVGDVVDAVLAAEIEDRPITFEEAIGTIQLLVLGGLETTAGVLGMSMLRFCEHPEIPALLRERPELIPSAVEELLRLDGSFINIGRTARHDSTINGHDIKAGERVVLFWSSANRDVNEFEDPERFDAERAKNRHIAFGAGPHRCAGSNLARMNLRVAFEELLSRMDDIELAPGAEIEWHSTNSRAPLSVPLRFTPGTRRS